MAGKAAALVTGAGSGIGKAVALRLAKDGYLVAAADIDAEAARAAAREIGDARAFPFQVDVARAADVAALASLVEREVGPIAIAVNSAGILRMGSIEDISLENWRDTFHVNVDGVFHVCRAIMGPMRERGRGSIVNIASWFGKVGKAHFGAYCASKFAVVGLTQSLAMEAAPLGITVNAVCPGTIVGTRMRQAADEGARRLSMPTALERQASIPLGRAGEPDDVAAVVSFLVSKDARYMTGQAINVTGGLWMT